MEKFKFFVKWIIYIVVLTSVYCLTQHYIPKIVFESVFILSLIILIDSLYDLNR